MVRMRHISIDHELDTRQEPKKKNNSIAQVHKTELVTIPWSHCRITFPNRANTRKIKPLLIYKPHIKKRKKETP